MVTLAVLPGMLRTSLMVADLANPGNSSRAINLLVSQRGIVGLRTGQEDRRPAPEGPHPATVLRHGDQRGPRADRPGSGDGVQVPRGRPRGGLRREQAR